MKTEFTPGPWRASHGTGPAMQGYSQPSAVTGTGDHRMKIVCGCFGDIGGPDVAAANAHLIAAAPTLAQYVIERAESGCQQAIAMLSSLRIVNEDDIACLKQKFCTPD